MVTGSPSIASKIPSKSVRCIGSSLAKARLRPILKQAADRGAFVYFDMEHYDVKDLTLQLFRDLLAEPELANLDAGVVIQAYLKVTPISEQMVDG